jgi:lambda repressor-like predicted transcriptional regulator
MSDKDELSEIRRANIITLLDHLGITRREFAKKISINSQTLSNCLQPDKPVTPRTTGKIYDAFPDLDVDCLDEPDFDPSKKKSFDPVVINQGAVMVTFQFPGKPIAIPLTFDEARSLLLSLLE